MFYIDFNNIKTMELGLAVATRPSIPTPQPRGEYAQVSGRDGALLVTDGTFENIQIDVEMNYVRRPVYVGESYRAIKTWLTGGGKLKMSDDPEVFYKVKAATVGGYSRRGRMGADLTASFICDPFTYFESGLYSVLPGKIYNQFYTACPQYVIEGEGVCTLTVNGNEITANVGQNLTIDTDLYIAYREDKTVMNTAITGEYEDMWLNHGENEVSITQGFDLKIIPNWRSL